MLKIVAVSYLNTVPFIYGIHNVAPDWIRNALTLAVPAACADSLLNKMADIALIPVAEIPNIENGKIITDFCISANGWVDTVALLSNSPMNQIKRVYLDKHSRTSVQLVRILAREHWKIDVEWIEGLPATGKIQVGEALLAIGDKVFQLEAAYDHKWDLAEEWKQMTSLPFVFAAWVSRTPEGDAAAEELNKALAYGCQHIAESIPHSFEFEKSYQYLTENIEFDLDSKKRSAIELFWKYLKEN